MDWQTVLVLVGTALALAGFGWAMYRIRSLRVAAQKATVRAEHAESELKKHEELKTEQGRTDAEALEEWKQNFGGP